MADFVPLKLASGATLCCTPITFSKLSTVVWIGLESSSPSPTLLPSHCPIFPTQSVGVFGYTLWPEPQIQYRIEVK